MAVLSYIDGYDGTLKVGSGANAVEFSVEGWTATYGGGMTSVAASKNGGWAVHRRGMKIMTGTATIVLESNVDTMEGNGPVPGNTVAMTLVPSAAGSSNIVGNFVVGEAVHTWDPGQPLKIAITFGNADAPTSISN